MPLPEEVEICSVPRSVPPAHNAIKEVAWKPKLVKDILLLADFVQTGGLEVFQGTMAKKYLPKSQHYSYNGMKCRTQLAIIDNNWNTGREVATTEAGGPI